ncbi:kinase-like domain-containing protein [Trametes punicea]|nr:kinase-like domain-containing protein [Trametes punicea]
MPFKKLLAFVKKAKVAVVPRNIVVDIAVKVEQVETVPRPEEILQQGFEAQGPIHVRMTFNEDGEVATCKMEHLEVVKAAPAALSNVTTLVGSPMPSKPVTLPPVVGVSQDKPKLVSSLCTTAASRDVLKPVTAASSTGVVAQALEKRILKVEDFRIIRVLGEGGQGLVLLVQDQVTDRLFALKVIKKHKLQTKDLSTVFVEQDIMKTLAGNPLFPALKGSFEDEDHFFLLTDYYPGGDLNDRIRKEGKLPTDVARRYAAQIVLAMEELRRQRIIHRDIKPKNILLTEQDEVIVTDFGLSRMFGRTVEQQPWRLRKIWQHKEDFAEDGSETISEMDKTQATCGTFGYIAPEMFTGDHSYEVDVWSFAVTLYEMLHGKLPFGFGDGSPTMEFITRVIVEAVEIDDEVDADANDLLQAMFAKDPNKRPTWEQIKEHPWFDSVDWDRIASRTPVSAETVSRNLEPDPNTRYIQFGESYADGEAEYPFFQWVAPELEAVPSASIPITNIQRSKWRVLQKADMLQPPIKEISAPFVPTVSIESVPTAAHLDVPRASKRFIVHDASFPSRQASLKPTHSPSSSVSRISRATRASYSTVACAGPSRFCDGPSLARGLGPRRLRRTGHVDIFAPDGNGQSAVRPSAVPTVANRTTSMLNAKYHGATTTAKFDAIMSDPSDYNSANSLPRWNAPDTSPSSLSSLSSLGSQVSRADGNTTSLPYDTSGSVASIVSSCSLQAVAFASLALYLDASSSLSFPTASIPLDVNSSEFGPSRSSVSGLSSGPSGFSCTIGSLAVDDANLCS